MEGTISIATGIVLAEAQNLSQKEPDNAPSSSPMRAPSYEEHGAYDDKRTLFNAICVSCGKNTKVPFKPDPTRSVYCKDCFAKIKQPSYVKAPEGKRISLSQLKPKPPEIKPSYAKATEGKKQRKSVDTEGLKKILEETLEKS